MRAWGENPKTLQKLLGLEHKVTDLFLIILNYFGKYAIFFLLLADIRCILLRRSIKGLRGCALEQSIFIEEVVMVAVASGSQVQDRITVEYEGKQCVVTDLDIGIEQTQAQWWYRDCYRYYPENWEDDFDEDAQRFPENWRFMEEFYEKKFPGVKVEVGSYVSNDSDSVEEGTFDVFVRLYLEADDGNWYDVYVEDESKGAGVHCFGGICWVDVNNDGAFHLTPPDATRPE